MAVRLVVLLLFMFCALQVQSQVREFDKLEMLYDQGHYKSVYRKASRLLDNPEFDYSRIPSFYKSITLFQLSQDPYWLKRNKGALDEAKSLFVKIKSSSDGIQVFEAHIYEVSALKRDLISWSEDLKRLGQQQKFENVHEILYGLFEGVPDIEYEGEIVVEDIKPTIVKPNTTAKGTKSRKKIIDLAKKQVGVPYVWAVMDPKGFDCSGFTSYVMLKSSDKKIPRRARDQYDSAIKLKHKNVQKGDLVFFNNGSGISHVGIIVSNRGEELTMIHASSTKGIVITNIEKSTYWKKRIHGFGTYVDSKN